MFNLLRNLYKIKNLSKRYLCGNFEMSTYDDFNLVQDGTVRMYYLGDRYISKRGQDLYFPSTYLIQYEYRKYDDNDIIFTKEQSTIISDVSSYDDTELLLFFGKKYTDDVLISSHPKIQPMYDFIINDEI